MAENKTSSPPIASQKPGPRAARLREMLRVDHAGEYAAVQIYRGQRDVFKNLPIKQKMTDLLEEMEQGEQEHLSKFNGLLANYKAPPTVFTPLWHLASYALGAGTALMGEKAAMACTAAVEEVIEKHYADQAEELGDTEPALKEAILQFREDELAHHDTAIEHGAEQAPGYGLLKAVIQTGCKAAIRLSEKI